jgi:hypothetical protein
MKYKLLHRLCPSNLLNPLDVLLNRVAVKVSNPPEVLCIRCHHPESEHGKTGFRPCLAMVGDLLTREFCKCNQFQAAMVRKAA